MTRTYIDSGVLIVAARGASSDAQDALDVLDDPQREFASSVFVRLETIPKASYNRRPAEVEFYEAFFAGAKQWPAGIEDIAVRAEQVAIEFGLNALDALHVAAAQAVGAEELITSEGPTKPIHRVKNPRVVWLRAAGKPAS